MCTDCRQQDVSRRRFIGTGAAGALAPLLNAAAWADKGADDVICRAAWGAKPPSGKFKHHKIERVTIHHSGVVLAQNRDAPAALRGAQAYHQGSGFPDIAYHFMIDRHGHIYKGRPRWARGDTFTEYPTKGHLLLMCEGNFEEQDISSQQLASLCDVAAWATRLFDIPIGQIKGHRDYAATACPGEDLYRRLENGSIKKRVRRRNESGDINLEQLCGKKGKRLVHRIEMGTD